MPQLGIAFNYHEFMDAAAQREQKDSPWKHRLAFELFEWNDNYSQVGAGI